MSRQSKVTIAMGLITCMAVLISAIPEMIRVFTIMFTTAIVETCETFQENFGVKVELYRGEGVNYHRYFYLTENSGAEWVKVLDSFEDSSGWRDNCSGVRFVGDKLAIMPSTPDRQDSFLVFARTPESVADIVNLRLTDYVYDCTAGDITTTSFHLDCLRDRPEPTAYMLRFKTEDGRVWYGSGNM